ncbi:hypothetical protein HmCmsJML035_04023 [Escherichia coli]|uniref:hypothetical protein n=1 Tax=Escherichia coli TaxID=562 RepID=UPI0010CC556B|nr:hypothetical protein [Escherichia coli]GCV07006.1 hypothetical protein HmCmsJML035_04023 [Escherichia coli]GCX96025.1 hypothetical protein HmCmsJML077_01345 [Escherichia coli]
MKRKIYLGLLLFVSASSVFANTVIQRHSGQITAAETVAQVKVTFPSTVGDYNSSRGGQFQNLRDRGDATFTPTVSPLKILYDAPYNCTFSSVSASAGGTRNWQWYKSGWNSASGSLCSSAKTVSGKPENIQGYIYWCTTGNNANPLYGLRVTTLSMTANMECSGESPVGKVSSQSVDVRTYIPLSNSVNSTSSYTLSYSYSNVVTKGITLNYTINEVMLTEQNTPSLLLDAKFDENSASKSGYVSLSPVNRNLASDMLHISRQDTGEQIPLDNTEVRFEDAIKLDVSTKTTGKHTIPLLVTLGLD